MSECILWGGSLNGAGYGVAWSKTEKKYLRAHRLAYERAFGPIKDLPIKDLCVLHHCDVRSCVNPEHLFLGTRADNIRDMDEKGRRKSQNSGKTHCVRGHRLSGANLYSYPDGRRSCRTCKKISRSPEFATFMGWVEMLQAERNG
jgi:hypothetical protein